MSIYIYNACNNLVHKQGSRARDTAGVQAVDERSGVGVGGLQERGQTGTRASLCSMSLLLFQPLSVLGPFWNRAAESDRERRSSGQAQRDEVGLGICIHI